MDSVKVAVIYYSATGTTHDLARAVAQGAREAGAEVRLLRVPETAPEEAIAENPDWQKHVDATDEMPRATMDDLRWADAMIFGTPTRFGLPTAQLKNFIDMAGPLWADGELVNKIASSFTSAATDHGGHETTLTAINNTFYHWGAIIVPPGYSDDVQFASGTPYGTTFISENGELDPDETALEAARYQGFRVAEVTQQFVEMPEPAL